MNKDGEVISLVEDMSEEFNKFFISVFTNEGNESTPEAELMYKGPRDKQLCDLEITEKRVLCELERLRDDKAAGADDLVLRFLSKIKGGISYPLTLLFQRIMEDRVWREGGPLRCAGWWWVSDFRPQVTTQRPAVPQMLS